MRRLGMILLLVALAALALAPSAMAAGGQNPGPPGKITGPAVSGVLVVDPHEDGGTDLAKNGAIRLVKGGRVAGAVFSTELPYTCGCDVALTNVRFANVKLETLIGLTEVVRMFTALGMIPPGGDQTALPGQPIITDINNASCTGSKNSSGTLITLTGSTCAVPSPPATPTPGGAPIAGTLSFDVVVQFFIQQ